jgi:hypothetical protein
MPALYGWTVLDMEWEARAGQGKQETDWEVAHLVIEMVVVVENVDVACGSVYEEVIVDTCVTVDEIVTGGSVTVSCGKVTVSCGSVRVDVEMETLVSVEKLVFVTGGGTLVVVDLVVMQLVDVE